jgi:hypothetical protein
MEIDPTGFVGDLLHQQKNLEEIGIFMSVDMVLSYNAYGDKVYKLNKERALTV